MKIEVEEGSYTQAEHERACYVSEKISKLIEKGPFSLMFGSVAGALFGYGMSAGLSVEEILKRLLFLTQHDSPDGRTAQEIIDSLKKNGGAS